MWYSFFSRLTEWFWSITNFNKIEYMGIMDTWIRHIFIYIVVLYFLYCFMLINLYVMSICANLSFFILMKLNLYYNDFFFLIWMNIVVNKETLRKHYQLKWLIWCNNYQRKRIIIKCTGREVEQLLLTYG